jgi:Alginate lyase
LYSVMHKKKTPPSGDKHDYMSQAPYWWADSTKKNGLPYIRRDGERNPEYYLISDSDEMDELEDDTEVLGLAYYFTNDEKYASLCSKLIKTWFLDKETKQNPNFNFSQGIPGINDGRGIGIIESRELLRIADAATLIKGSKNWTENDHSALKKWYADYLTWLKENPLGKDEAKEHNNHGTFYDVQIVAYSLFTDNPESAKQQIEVTKKRIQSQLQADGSQPFELERTVSWGYVNMNLWGFIQIAKMAEKVNIDLWEYETPDGKNLQKAVDWLIPYVKREKKWSYKQIKKMTYEDTVDIMKSAAIAYQKSEYENLAKSVDAKIYNTEFYQLTF